MCKLTDTLNHNICNQKGISQSDYESPLGRKMKLLKSPKTIATIHAFYKWIWLLQFQLGVSCFSGFLIGPDYIRESDINAVELVLL